MNSISLPTNAPFDYQLLMNQLAEGYNAPRNKILSMCRSGEIVRVKKGLYVPAYKKGEASPVNPNVLAGLIYGPSYISLETALSHYGLISERVDEITCVTIKRSKTFSTPLGRFTYTPISEQAFPIGVKLEAGNGGSWFLAEPEKAICDRLAQVKKLSAMRDVALLLQKDLRIDIHELMNLRLPLILKIATHYRRKNVSAFAHWFEKQHKNYRLT